MANELISIGSTTGLTLYATVQQLSTGSFWKTDQFETKVNANQSLYAVPLTETPASSRFWVADFPAVIPTSSGPFQVVYWIRLGATPAYTDTIVSSTILDANLLPTTQTISLGTLVTVDEYVSASGSVLSSPTLSMLLSSASKVVESVCQQTFHQETMTGYFNGNGTPWLVLDGVPASLTSVTLDYESSSPTSVATNQFNWTDQGILYWLPTATQWGYFPGGWHNIKVIYTTTSSVPDSVKAAVIMIASDLERKVGGEMYIDSKTVGDTTVHYNDATLSPELMSTVNEILASYKRFVLR